MPTYFTVNTIAELICFLISLLCLFKEKNPVWKSFIIYLFLVYAVETGGIFLREISQPNVQLYTIYFLFECTMISVFFSHLFRKYKSRVDIVLYAWLALFMILYTLELWDNKFQNFPFKTAAFMSVVFVVASCYFYLLVIRDEKFRELSTYPSFWMVNGILFFYFGGTACNLFYDYLSQQSHTVITMSIRYITFNILNVLLYSCWSYAFICRYRQRNSSSSLL